MDEYYKIAKAIDYIKTNFKNQPSLDEIAVAINLSPFHFQRLFTEWAGVSPKKFLSFLTLEYAKTCLMSNTLSEASYNAGLSGTGRLHDLFVGIEGMTPGEYKNGGESLSISYTTSNSSAFGNYLIASTSKGICQLLFYEDDEESVIKELRTLWLKAKLVEGNDDNHEIVRDFFKNDFKDANKIKLHLKGTEFQVKVWEALLKIPEGAIRSYNSIAQAIDKPTANRAVGSAIGDNPIAFIIPCHRVIKSAGGIGEYRWGSARKQLMLGWEAAKNCEDKD